MIEKIIYDYLVEKLGSINVYPKIPNNPPNKFIVYEKTAGGMRDHIKRATIAIQSYDDTVFKASELNEIVKEKMLGIVELPQIASIKLNSDYNFTDIQRKRDRYQSVFDIDYY